ncbi:hypothetical protein glysoja_018963 [Glycine soja]|nr:hypothetical protein glysoja_018963 [Glycine soja]
MSTVSVFTLPLSRPPIPPHKLNPHSLSKHKHKHKHKHIATQEMKLAWSPERASKAYIDTVQSCQVFRESGVAEFISAMAAGWNSQLIVETWSQGGLIAAGVTAEIVVGEPEDVMEGLVGVDFLVVDSRRKDFTRVLRLAKLSNKGAVLLCKNANSNSKGFIWRSLVAKGSSRRVVRSAFLPVGKGLDMAHVSASGGNNSSGHRWIKHVDQHSGDVHFIRR